MGALKNFAVSLVKITLAIAIALVIVGLVAWGVSEHLANSKAAAQAASVAPLANPTTWTPITVAQFDSAQFNLRTMWKGENIYYQFTVKGYPAAFAQARGTFGS